MKRLFLIIASLILSIGLIASPASGQGGVPLPVSIVSSTPSVLFTDLDSGPNTGGENGNGAWLTIYGNNFGASQSTSTVTIGGGAVAAVKFWTSSKIVVQLGAGAVTGAIVVTVGGKPSNSIVTFAVRAGNIRCVSPTGSDSATGLWGACNKTIGFAVEGAAPKAGDIIYVRAGTYPGQVEMRDSGGTAGNPIAVGAYPGETVTVGTTTLNTIIVENVQNVASYWTVFGMFVQGYSVMGIGGGVSPTNGWRVVGNDMTCPLGFEGSGEDACIEMDLASNVKFWGNKVHHVATSVVQSNISKLYHAVYWSTDSNHLDVAWNEVGPSGACRGIQFHSSPNGGDGPGHQQFDIHVHDNYVHDIRCDGINFATVDPSQGVVEAYNNVITNAGSGPDPADGPADYAGIYFAQILNAGKACALNCNAQVYNNTFYKNGQGGSSGNGQSDISANSGPVVPVIKNNIFYASGESYLSVGTITCSNDLFFGNGGIPSSCTASLNVDPKFVSNFTDFHLQSTSPAINVGLASPCSVTDKDGIVRPQGSGCDLGAYEFISGTLARPAPPTNLQIIVH